MTEEQKEKLINYFNDTKLYAIDLELFIWEKKNFSFNKEDNIIWKYIATKETLNFDQMSILKDKLKWFEKNFNKTNYMYYFDNKDSLFSRLIKNKQLLILNELLKTHSNILSAHLSDVNNKNNILHLLLKQKYSEDDMFFKLNLMTNIIRISKNKNKLLLQKDEHGHSFLKYFTDITSQNILQQNKIKKNADYSLFYSSFYDIIKHYTPELFSSIKVDLYKDFLLPLQEVHSHAKYEDIKKFIFQVKILKEKEIINKTIKNIDDPVENIHMKKRI